MGRVWRAANRRSPPNWSARSPSFKKGGGKGYANVESFLDALPAEPPESCPDCGGSLAAAAMFADDDGIAVVRLVCLGIHGDGVAATYVYDVASGGLYLERETPVD